MELKQWVAFARNTFQRHIKLIADPGSAEGLASLFGETSVGKLHGTEGGAGPFVGVHYSCGQAGEASARAHLRVPQFREAHCIRMVKGALAAAGNPDVFPGGHIFVMTDGKAHSNVDRMQKCFQDSNSKSLPKKIKTLYVMTTEESERETKERMSGIATLPTMEITTLYTQMTISVPLKKHLHCGGSNCSDTLGPLQRPAKTYVWCVKQTAKSKLYGASLVEVGGRVEGDAGVEADPGPKPHEQVPFCWHTKPTEYYEELMHAYTITDWWDLTAVDVTLPMLAMRKKFAYLGVCHTKEHQEALAEECIERVFKAMQDPQDVLYESRLSDLLKTSGSGSDTIVAEQTTPQNQKKDPADKTQPKTTTKKTASSASSAASAILEKLQKLDDGDFCD